MRWIANNYTAVIHWHEVYKLVLCWHRHTKQSGWTVLFLEVQFFYPRKHALNNHGYRITLFSRRGLKTMNNHRSTFLFTAKKLLYNAVLLICGHEDGYEVSQEVIYSQHKKLISILMGMDHAFNTNYLRQFISHFNNHSHFCIIAYRAMKFMQLSYLVCSAYWALQTAFEYLHRCLLPTPISVTSLETFRHASIAF